MLFSQIKLGYPSLWVKSVDTFKTIESIVNFDSRAYFMINSSGFSQYVDKVWKPVLVPMPNPNNPDEQVFTTTYDFTVANEFLKSYQTNLPKSFIFNIFAQHDEFVSTFAGIFNNAAMQYRDAFWSNDVTQMPTQYIVISNADCPQDFNHIFKTVETSYPTREEIITVLSHLDKASEGLLVRQPVKSIVDAALGLSESELINFSLQSILEVGEVSADYIYAQKMKDIKKNGILEIIKPKVHFNNIGGLDTIKDLIIRNANLWHNPDQAAKFGISPIRRMLMVGIPGTGKSAICEATANALGLDLARTGVSQVMNSYIGQSEQNMRLVFQQIHAMSPLCVWIDEFGRDLSGGTSSSHVDGGTTDRVHGEFLTGLQELPDNVFLMCAANQLDHLKPEMLRADRFDKIMFVGLPGFNERKDILSIYLSNIETDHNFNLDAISNATQYFTGAEIKSLIKEVKFYVSSSELRAINTSDILSYTPKMRNILWNKSRPMIQDLYRSALDQWDWASSEQLDDAKLVLNPSRGASPSTPKIPVSR
jgi:ATP-dependent 26S proteasome regulatory subunit